MYTAVVGRDFIELGVFITETEFAQLAMARVTDYLDALQEGDAEKKMQILRRTFLLNLGCESDKIICRMDLA